MSACADPKTRKMFRLILIAGLAIAAITFEEWTQTHDSWLSSKQYCMRWCDRNTTLEGINLYPELSPEQAIQTESRLGKYQGELQQSGEEALGVVCCHVCTRDCFQVVLDSRQDTFDPDVTIVTTSTESRWNNFVELRKAWDGPLAILFYVSDYMEVQSRGNIGFKSNKVEVLKKKIQSARSVLDNTLILVYEAKWKRDRPTSRPENTVRIRDEKGTILVHEMLPINSLRNAILDHVMTRYVLPLDVDFIPSPGLYDDFLDLASFQSYEGKAIILPHWQVSPCAVSSGFIPSMSSFPKSFDSFYDFVRRGAMNPFHASIHDLPFSPEILNYPKLPGCEKQKSNGKNYWGISLTNYPLWLQTSSENPVAESMDLNLRKGRKDYHSWEPFFIISRILNGKPMIRYNELFVARILNKVQWISSLRESNVQFSVLLRHYLIHKHHRPSVFAAVLTSQHPDFRSRMKIALNQQVAEIAQTRMQISQDPFFVDMEEDSEIPDEQFDVEVASPWLLWTQLVAFPVLIVLVMMALFLNLSLLPCRVSRGCKVLLGLHENMSRRQPE